MTASQLAAACDIPESTLYRKLALLSEASLLTEHAIIHPDGQHTTQYRDVFDFIHLQLTEIQEFEVAIDRPARTADERGQRCARSYDRR